MKSNLLPLDMILRAGGGMFLLASPLLELHTYPYNLLGVVPVATALMGYCPLYAAVRALLLPARGGLRTGSV